jgi:hypothetical protein
MPHKLAYTYLFSRHKAEKTQTDQETVNVSRHKEANEMFYEFSTFTELPSMKMKEAPRPIRNFHYAVLYISALHSLRAIYRLLPLEITSTIQ